MSYEEQEKAIKALKSALKYVKQAHDNAEAKHDSCGEYYMDAELYDVIQKTEKLENDINEIISTFNA